MSIPNHIAIIPDGNRRWAKAQRLNPWDGHTEGAKRFWDASNQLFDLGVQNLTFWAASYDNLKKRSKVEVSFLMKLLETQILNPDILEKSLNHKVRVRVIGEWKEFIKSKKVLEAIASIEEKTKNFKNASLNILFAYDGQREMLAATNSLVKHGQKVTDANLRKELWTGVLPDVDLVIRTGGEPHWSAGFMMWLTANSQLYFTETLWPDFKQKEINSVLSDSGNRERRLGK